MTKKILYTLVFISITFNLKAEGYRILVNWEGLEDSTIFLVHYYNSSNFIDDTLTLDSSGQGIFTGDENLKEGLYMLYFNNKTYFDFLLGDDQELQISTSLPDFYGNLKIEGATSSEDFLNYQRVLREKQTQKREITQGLNKENQEEIEAAREKLNQMDNEMDDFISSEMARSGNSIYNVFLKVSKQMIIPEPPVSADHPKYDSIAWFHSYNYRRDHFLENIDFNDERFAYNPIFKPKLENYFEKILIQSPDSLVPQVLNIVHRAYHNEEMLQIVSQYFLNKSASSKIMGMDAVFVAIADAVYLKNKATWIKSDSIIRKIAEEAYLARPNLIGKQAPDLTLTKIDGEPLHLYEIEADFLVLAFYEYDCGHCKKDIPALYDDVYMKYLDKNIEVVAVCMNDDHEKWSSFVEEKGLDGWYHAWDPPHESKFRFKYNTKTAPTIYLLDRNKKILAKRLDNDNLARLIESLLK